MVTGPCYGRRERGSGLRRIVIVGVAALAALASNPATPADAGGPQIRVIKVADLRQPVGFTFTPNGRIVYLERDTGKVRFLNPATGRDRVFFRIGGVDAQGERGALGVALHPDWPRRPFVYVYVTRGPGRVPLQNQLLRLRDVRGRGADLTVLLRSPIGARANHNGGRIAFGPDGKLYVVIGDGGEDPSTAQDLTSEPRGKILRLNPGGSIPPTNPFPGSPVWSFGHRNSIGFAFDPQTGRLWETENGPDCNDEVNRIVKGGNFAWGPSQACGSLATPADTNQDGPTPRQLPQLWFTDTIAITGAAFCERCGLGAMFAGDLILGCANGTCKADVGPLAHVDLNAARTQLVGGARPIVQTDHTGPVYSMEVAPDGHLYFSDAKGIYRLAPA